MYYQWNLKETKTSTDSVLLARVYSICLLGWLVSYYKIDKSRCLIFVIEMCLEKGTSVIDKSYKCLELLFDDFLRLWASQYQDNILIYPSSHEVRLRWLFILGISETYSAPTSSISFCFFDTAGLMTCLGVRVWRHYTMSLFSLGDFSIHSRAIECSREPVWPRDWMLSGATAMQPCLMSSKCRNLVRRR